LKRKCALLLLFSLILSSSFLLSFTVGSFPEENSWTNKAPMPQAMQTVKAVVVNDKIYVIGDSYNYQYDPATDNWTSRTSMPTSRTAFGIAVYQNKIYTIGGWNFNDGNSIYYSVNEVYDPSTDSWQVKQPCPTNRLQLDANVINDRIYLIGGKTGGQFTTVGTTDVYDVVNDSWTTKESMLYPVAAYASAVSDGKIYVMGGQDEYLHNQIDVNFTQIYDIVSDSWSLGSPTPTAVTNAAAGATTGIMAPKRIYLFGGYPNGGIGATNLTQVYDIQSNTWTYGASMPIARAYFATATINDSIYTIGGSSLITRPVTTEVDVYTPYGYGMVQPTPSSSSNGVLLDLSAIAIILVVIVLLGIVIFYIKHKSLLKKATK
jgi:N-acetylneuraminic acid mutarotase